MFALWLAVGSFWFWAAAIVALVACVLFVHAENGVGTTLSLLVFLVGIHLLGDAGLATWVLAHGLETLVLAGLYFVVGALYSIVKWYFYVRRIREAYEEARVSYIKRYATGDIGHVDERTAVPDGLRQGWAREVVYVGDTSFRVDEIANMSLSKHKGRFTLWIGYWPFSAALTLLNDPLRALVRVIRERLTETFRSIARHAFRNTGIEQDISDSPEALEKKRLEQEEEFRRNREAAEKLRQENARYKK